MARDDDDPKWRAPRLMPSVTRTTKGLRDAIFDEIDEIRAGSDNYQKAHTISKLAGQIVNIARAEMAFHKLAKGEGPDDLVERAKVSALPDNTNG